MLQRYVDEAANLIATEEFAPNREPWKFAQVLPSIPEIDIHTAARSNFGELRIINIVEPQLEPGDAQFRR